VTNSAALDPTPALIEKLSSEKNINVKIRNNYDNLNYPDQKRNLIQLETNWYEQNQQLPNFTKLSQIFSNRRSPNFPSQEQKHLLSKLKYIPCYTVVNSKNEIVMASPRTYESFNSLKWLQNKYLEFFFWSGDKESVSLSLFFMNREDAATYLHEICKREPKESEIRGLKIKTTGLDVFYRFNRTSPPKVQTRLICDLQEIDLLLKDYIKKSSTNMHSKQKYSDSWFQGTPIYTLRTYSNSKEKNILSCSSELNSQKKLIFFNREDALKAWKCHLLNTNQGHLKNSPNLEIYNLESLLLELENNKIQYIENTMIIPPSSYMQSKVSNSQTYGIKEIIFKTKLKLKECQRFYKGLIWLFTSDTLPSEENSW